MYRSLSLSLFLLAFFSFLIHWWFSFGLTCFFLPLLLYSLFKSIRMSFPFFDSCDQDTFFWLFHLYVYHLNWWHDISSSLLQSLPCMKDIVLRFV